jgi:3-dehydroquinate synthetase
MERISIDLSQISYDYWLGHDCTDEIVERLLELSADRYFVIADEDIRTLHAEGFVERLRSQARTEPICHPEGENAKRLAEVERVIDEMLRRGATRASCIVAFGGGVTGNLAGLVAALLFRGIRLVHVPTTLVSIHDSVISLKQAVNAEAGKNLIGTYYVPEMVLADTAYLATLKTEHLRSGLCEVIKNALAIRPDQIPDLRRSLRPDASIDPGDWVELIRGCIAAKLAVMCEDPREKHSGLVLEYGHTVGHAIEHTADGTISHGEAVGLGMLVAADVAYRMGHLDGDARSCHWDLLRQVGLQLERPRATSIPAVMEKVRADNKRGHLPPSPGKIPMVLLGGLGSPLRSDHLPLVPVSLDLVEEAMGVIEPAAAAGAG